jgi:DNA-binding XRE family transcriptional regulator
MSREVVRCHKCHCNQFATESRTCRKCGEPYSVATVAVSKLVKPKTEPKPATKNEDDHEAMKARVRNNIVAARLALKITQRKLAARIGVPRTHISKLENNRCSPSLYSLFRIAKALGVEAADLLR